MYFLWFAKLIFSLKDLWFDSKAVNAAVSDILLWQQWLEIQWLCKRESG